MREISFLRRDFEDRVSRSTAFLSKMEQNKTAYIGEFRLSMLDIEDLHELAFSQDFWFVGKLS